MQSSFELLAKVKEYVDRQVTLSELESWLAPRLQFYLRNPDSRSAKLAGLVELCLSEIQAGIRTEGSVRRMLSRRLNAEPAVFAVLVTSASSNEATTATSSTSQVSHLWPAQSQSWYSAVQEVCA